MGHYYSTREIILFCLTTTCISDGGHVFFFYQCEIPKSLIYKKLLSCFTSESCLSPFIFLRYTTLSVEMWIVTSVAYIDAVIGVILHCDHQLDLSPLGSSAIRTTMCV